MSPPKVIITKQLSITSEYSLENEIGLSTYDLALISINKITQKIQSSINQPSLI